MPDRPAPLRLESLSCTVVRGPRADGRWYWRARRADVTLWTGWATREEADAACARLTLGQPTDGPVRTVRDLLDAWFAEQEDREESGQLASSSLDTLRAATRALLRELGPVHIGTVTATTLERYRDTRLRPGPTPRRAEGQRGRLPRRGSMCSETVARELRLLRQAWTWGHERGLVPSPTLPRVALRVRAEVERHTPTADEVLAVLEHLEGWPRLAVALLWATGCRLGEIAGLRRRDVDAGRAMIRVRGKTGPRAVVVAREAMAALLPLLPTDPEARVFGVTASSVRTSLRRYLTDACEAAGCPRWTAHALRRHATDALYEAGADPGVESAQLGHGPRVALKHYRRARSETVRIAVERAGLGVLPAPAGGGELVLLEVASQDRLEAALVEAARRGDLAEVNRITGLLSGAHPAQNRL